MPRAHVLPDGNQVAALRGEADLTQWELACEAGYGLRTIGKIEHGQATAARTLSAVATVLSRRLKRPVALGDLLRRQAERNGNHHVMLEEGLLVDEAVQFLDLSRLRPARPGQESRAILHDHFSFRRLPEQLTTLAFYYATVGDRIEGRCESHAQSSAWRDISHAGKSAMNASYQLDVRLASPLEAAYVENRLEYVNAFAGNEEEWFHTHVVYPTLCLTIVLLFSDVKRCRSVKGLCRHHPVAPFDAAADQPIVMADGRMVHWRIRTPEVGASYQMEWQW